MADTSQVHAFLDTFARPELRSGLDGKTETSLASLLDRHSQDDLAKMIEERVSATALPDASAEDIAHAVDELNQPVGEPDAQAVLAELAEALGADARDMLAGSEQEFFAYVVEQLWPEVRDQLADRLAGESLQESELNALAWQALMAAVDGLWEAGQADGGYPALLSRPHS